jgi:hypothetical protein
MTSPKERPRRYSIEIKDAAGLSAQLGFRLRKLF